VFLIFFKWVKLRCSALGFPIIYKHMVALTNRTQIVLSLLRTIKFNAVMCLNLIGEPSVQY